MTDSSPLQRDEAEKGEIDKPGEEETDKPGEKRAGSVKAGEETGAVVNLASNVQKKCTTFGNNFYSVLSWIGRILWVIVPILLVIVLVSILISSMSDSSTWTRALGACDKIIHVDFMVLNADGVKELESLANPASSSASSSAPSSFSSSSASSSASSSSCFQFQKTNIASGSYVLLDFQSDRWDAGVYIFAPEASSLIFESGALSCEDDAPASRASCLADHGPFIHVQDIDADCKYVVRKGMYRNQVYQPSHCQQATSSKKLLFCCDGREAEETGGEEEEETGEGEEEEEEGTCSSREMGSGCTAKCPRNRRKKSCPLPCAENERESRIYLKISELRALSGDAWKFPSVHFRSGAQVDRVTLEFDVPLPETETVDLRDVPPHSFTVCVTGKESGKLRFQGEEGAVEVAYQPASNRAALCFEMYEGRLR
jgi:hypothetical protein